MRDTVVGIVGIVALIGLIVILSIGFYQVIEEMRHPVCTCEMAKNRECLP